MSEAQCLIKAAGDKPGTGTGMCSVFACMCSVLACQSKVKKLTTSNPHRCPRGTCQSQPVTLAVEPSTSTVQILPVPVVVPGRAGTEIHCTRCIIYYTDETLFSRHLKAFQARPPHPRGPA
jgi:hypothetical protein